MCIAIVKPRGVSLAEDRLRLCFENNPDGAGFAIATDELDVGLYLKRIRVLQASLGDGDFHCQRYGEQCSAEA